MKIEQIAKATHEMNRTFCQQLGDHSQVPWAEAPEWQRHSAIEGVQAVFDGTATTPEEQHAAWMQSKVSTGWTYGEVKDAEKKTHPCMVPYDELPLEQQAKDKIFRIVVGALMDYEDPSQ